jgi:protease I
MSANYTSVRLRYFGELPENPAQFEAREFVQSAPVVRFFAAAMQNSKVVKGMLCHGLWVLTPVPGLLNDRKVICNSVVMSDIINCGAQVVLTPDKVVKDRDLVTGFSKHEVLPFIAAIAEQISALQQ